MYDWIYEHFINTYWSLFIGIVIFPISLVLIFVYPELKKLRTLGDQEDGNHPEG